MDYRPASLGRRTNRSRELLGFSPLKGWPEQLVADAARLADAARRGDIIGHAAAPLGGVPGAGPKTHAFRVAAVVRDLTGTPLRGVPIQASLGSEAQIVITDARGMAHWAPSPPAGEDSVKVMLALQDGSRLKECRLSVDGWEAPRALTPRAVVCDGRKATVARFWVRLPGNFNKRFARQDRALREMFFPFRTMMLRRFVRIHREAASVRRDRAIGGRSGYRDYDDVLIYDPAADVWARGPAIPPRGTAGAAVFRNAIYVFGGESQSRFRTLDDVFRLGPGASKWTLVATLPHARNYARAVVFRSAVYVVGGSTTPGDSHGSAGSTWVDRFSG